MGDSSLNPSISGGCREPAIWVHDAREFTAPAETPRQGKSFW